MSNDIDDDYVEVNPEELEKDESLNHDEDSISKSEKKDVDKCTLCGLCKAVCPTYKASKNELYSPRARMLLLKNKKVSTSFYDCTLCGACIEACPLNLDGDFRSVRDKLTSSGRETKNNKKMIENIRKHGNPYGKVEEGKKPKELYCC